MVEENSSRKREGGGGCSGQKCTSESKCNNHLCRAHDSHLADQCLESTPTPLLEESSATHSWPLLNKPVRLEHPPFHPSLPFLPEDGTAAMPCLEFSLLYKETSLCPLYLIEDRVSHSFTISFLYSFTHSFNHVFNQQTFLSPSLGPGAVLSAGAKRVSKTELRFQWAKLRSTASNFRAERK